jgi:RimJ/RimL family protein N-acetyltransferase/SAM-dependent methyltransferase
MLRYVAVELRLLDEDILGTMLDLAVAATDPTEVMPPLAGPPGWTPQRVDAFREFYRARFGGLDNALSTAAYAIIADGQVAGMIRMSREDEPRTVEAGIWLGRPFRGRGIGSAAVRSLLLSAAEAGADTVIADTSPDNAAALRTLRRLGAKVTSQPRVVYAAIPVWGGVVDVNRANWDARAAVHGQDGFYDSAGLIEGTNSLTAMESDGVRSAVGDVRGLDVLHVQCHLGFNAISLARAGARVVGVDFSPASLAKAADLAQRCGVPVEFVEADVMDLPPSLSTRFDLAYATIGIMCWIGDVGAWMRSVAATLKPGGRLLLIDGHPLANMVASVDPLVLDSSYAYDGPEVLEAQGTYTDRSAKLASTTNVQFSHSLGEIVTAAVAAGLRVISLEEHLSSTVDTRGEGMPDPDGHYRLRLGGQSLPTHYTLIAGRP